MIFFRHKFFLSLPQVLESESWIYVLFLILSVNVGALRIYLLLILFLLVAVYLINQKLITSVWLSFVGTYLLRQSKLFIKPYVAPDSYLNFSLREPEIVFFIAFSDALLALLTFLLIRKRFKDKSRTPSISFSLPHALLILVLSLGVIASWLSPLPEVSWFWLLQLGKLFLMSLYAVLLTQDNKVAKKTLEIIFIYGLFLAGLVVAQKLNGGPLGLVIEERYTLFAGRFADESPDLYRPGGIFWDANLASSILIMFLPTWLIFSLVRKWFHQGFMLVCFLTGSLALVFTASRASWVIGAMLLAICYQFVIKTNQKKIFLPKWIKKYSWLFFIIAALTLMPMILSRLVSLNQVFQGNGGAIYRWRHLQMAAHYILTKPFGLGVNVFQYAILDRWKPDYYLFDSTPAHNIFAQIGAALGLGGLLLFAKFIQLLIVNGYKQLVVGNKILVKGLILGCFGYLLVSQFYPWWLTLPISGIVWLLLGVAYAQAKKT